MFVLTADQQSSRRRGDRVPELLSAIEARLAATDASESVVRPFERTVGDEVQGLVADPGVAVDLALHLQRLGGWSVGIGAGDVDDLADTARASAGPAFIAARAAVERARSRAVPVPLAVNGAQEEAARDAEAVLHLAAAVVRRRSRAGWEAVDALAAGTQRHAAQRLGISAQAVSQRLRAAMWEEELGVRPTAARLLDRAAVTS